MISHELAFPHFRLTAFCEGSMLLDGGAMYGVVPKVLWEKKTPAGPDNRIKLALNSLLIDNGQDIILVETGIGTTLKRKHLDIYGVDSNPGLIPALKKIGFAPDDITLVVNTHLHFDHCGGNTIRNASGEIIPAFPRAKYIIQKGEWEHALHPNERDRASYLKENFLPLQEAGRLELIEGNVRISKGVESLLTPGHTAHHQCVKISSEDKTVLFLGDLVPMSSHVGLPYIMSYDLFPLQTLETKKKVYDLACRGNWVFAFVHDPRFLFGRLEKSGQRYGFRPLS